MSRRESGELEQEVLRQVAALGGSASVADVRENLPGGPAYTTVMTTLARLAGKGALHRKRVGRAFHYSLTAPVDSVENVMTARRMRRLLTDGGDHAGVLARFVEELDPAEERLLAELLDRKELLP